MLFIISPEGHSCVPLESALESFGNTGKGDARFKCDLGRGDGVPSCVCVCVCPVKRLRYRGQTLPEEKKELGK